MVEPRTYEHKPSSGHQPGQRLLCSHSAPALGVGKRVTASSQTTLCTLRGEPQPASAWSFYQVSASALKSGVCSAP